MITTRAPDGANKTCKTKERYVENIAKTAKLPACENSHNNKDGNNKKKHNCNDIDNKENNNKDPCCMGEKAERDGFWAVCNHFKCCDYTLFFR